MKKAAWFLGFVLLLGAAALGLKAAVAGIIGLLAALATVGVVRHRQDVEDAWMQAEMMTLYKAMEAYRNYGRYPMDYAQLGEFVSVPNFDRRYEINPNP